MASWTRLASVGLARARLAGLDLALLYGLLLAGLLIGVAGVVNTMVLSVLERTREIAMLRAVGASPTQVRRIVRAARGAGSSGPA